MFSHKAHIENKLRLGKTSLWISVLRIAIDIAFELISATLTIVSKNLHKSIALSAASVAIVGIAGIVMEYAQRPSNTGFVVTSGTDVRTALPNV